MEILRAAAVSMVLLQHMPYLLPGSYGWFLPGGWLEHLNFTAGVDIFFCLSGFVVVRALRREMEGLDRAGTNVAIGRFWLRRAFRLWPTAWLWLNLAYLTSLVFNRSGIMNSENNLRLIVPGMAMYLNIVDLNDIAQRRPFGTMELYWTLSQEEQFYAAFPLLLAFGGRVTVVCVLAFIAYSMVFGVGFWLWFMLRLGSLLAGVLLAFAEGGVVWRRLQSSRLLANGFFRVGCCLALCLLDAAICAIRYDYRFFGIPLVIYEPLMLALVSATLVAGAAVGDRGVRPSLVKRALLALGRRSYVLYAVHPVPYAMAQEIMFRIGRLPDWQAISLQLLLGAALLAIATELTVRLVERPLRGLGRRLAQTSPAGLASVTQA